VRSTKEGDAVLVRIAALAALALLASACERDDTPAAAPAPAAAPPASAPTPAPAAGAASAEAAVAEARQIFELRCVTCHGPQGAGDGPASAGLTPHPRNFQDPAWQASVSDAHIEQIIKYGGAAVGRSPAMPPNPDLNAKPEVVAALRAHVRGLAKP
jgi:mono/diheme cytochrome c family protein